MLQPVAEIIKPYGFRTINASICMAVTQCLKHYLAIWSSLEFMLNFWIYTNRKKNKDPCFYKDKALLNTSQKIKLNWSSLQQALLRELRHYEAPERPLIFLKFVVLQRSPWSLPKISWTFRFIHMTYLGQTVLDSLKRVLDRKHSMPTGYSFFTRVFTAIWILLFIPYHQMTTWVQDSHS